jgi:hypothetical protein
MEDRPRVLLVGAYERDNFGDLLFLLVTERYLAGADVTAAAPFAADMSSLLHRTVPAYTPLLRSERFDVVWTVGGEVGSIDARRAYRLSAPPSAYRRFLRATEGEQAEIVRRAAGGATPLAPYIPALHEFPHNAGALSLVNSAGVRGLARVDLARRERLLGLLRGQTEIAVRDRASSDLLTGEGIAHRLVPDAVHAVSRLWPAPLGEEPGDVAVVQMSRAILGRLGHEAVATQLVSAASLRGLRLRLLLAGTATGHDTVDDLATVRDHVRRLAPGRDVEVVMARRPLDLVEHLRTARVVIGTSLHVRIVAAAYAVPRVSLSKPKPTRYARTWDAAMPFDVALEDLDEAVGRALELGRDPAIAQHAADLSRRAHEHLTRTADEVLERARTSTPADVERRAAARTALSANRPRGRRSRAGRRAAVRRLGRALRGPDASPERC